MQQEEEPPPTGWLAATCQLEGDGEHDEEGKGNRERVARRLGEIALLLMNAEAIRP